MKQKRKAAIKPIQYTPMFTGRQMLRPTLIRWLYRNGRLTEWKV